MDKLTIRSLDEHKHFKETKYYFTNINKALVCLKQELIMRAIDHDIQDEEYLKVKEELLTCETIKEAYLFINNAPKFFNEYVSATYSRNLNANKIENFQMWCRINKLNDIKLMEKYLSDYCKEYKLGGANK